jgi:hypothetical protein
MLSQSGEIRGSVETLLDAPTFDEIIEESGAEAGEIIVFLEPAGTRFSLGPFKPFEKVRRIVIRAGRQSPQIQLVTVDQPFRFHNLDSIHHELFTANSENSLRIPLKGGSESQTLRLAGPSLVRIFCALHPDENHTLVVSAGHEYAFVDSNSRFTIPNVRPGRYRVRAANTYDWSQPQTVNLGTSETIELKLRLAPDQND